MSSSGRRPPARRQGAQTSTRRARAAARPPRRSLFGFDRRRRRARGAGSSEAGNRDAIRTGVGRRALVPALMFAVAIVGVLSLAVVPTRTYLERRSEISEAEAQLARLVSANEADAERIAALGSDAELERVARRNFRLALPGEEVYRVLPPEVDSGAVPSGWPFDHLARRLADG